MDNRVSVEGYGPMSSLSLASRSLRVIALAALAPSLTACGGGGGGGDEVAAIRHRQIRESRQE